MRSESSAWDLVCEEPAPYITSHKDLRVYSRAFELALEIDAFTDRFPDAERFRLTDQVIRSSRSVCSSVAEAWRKRRYRAAFVSKLSDAEAECAETQTWLEFALAKGYIKEAEYKDIESRYEGLIRALVTMISMPEKWSTLPRK